MARQAVVKKINTEEDDVPTPGLSSLGESLHQLDVVTNEREANVRAIAAQIHYQLPADSIDADLIQRDIAASMRRSVEACLEVGRGLTVLKATCEHGDFIDRLDSLGIDRSVAVRFMQSSRKFANVASNASFQKAIGSQTKLFEMLILDDEQIEELELTGQTGELKLDDIATMSVKELRAAVRAAKQDESKVVAELKADAEANDRLLGDKNAKIDELEKRIHRLENRAGEWNQRVFEISMENTRALSLTMNHLDQIDTLRDIILTEDFGDQDKETAIEHMAIVYCDSISQIIDRVAELSLACDAVFSGYKDKAKPILEVFLNAPAQE